MNRKLTDEQITAAARSLRESGQRLSGRALRAVLRRQYGAAGKTDRLFALCRELQPSEKQPPIISELRGALRVAEQDRAAALEERDRAVEGAERSETREIAHHDRWANEIHVLREQVLRLQQELRVLRQRAASVEGQGG
jgi:hypothetical protein